MKKMIKNDFGITSEDIQFSTGTTLSNLDGRLWKEIGFRAGRFFGEEAMVRARMGIETRYLIALSKASIIRKLTSVEVNSLQNIHKNLKAKDFERLKEIEAVVRHDLMAMNELLKEKMIKGNIAKDIANSGWIHWGLTTEDVDNLAKSVLLKEFLEDEYFTEAQIILQNIKMLAASTNDIVIPGKTHLQTAVPTILGKEVCLFGYRLAEQFLNLKSTPIKGKLAGAVGSMAAHKISKPQTNWKKFSKTFVESLGLVYSPYTTQIESRNSLISLLHIVESVNLILIDMSQDFRIYTGFGWLNQKEIKVEVGSSTMPQKINPIDFENSQGNANFSNWLLEGYIRTLPVSWLQRDLTDKSMLRNLGLPFGHSLLALLSASKGVNRVSPDTDAISQELNSDWGIIAEGIQILLRSEGQSGAYNSLKELSRGKKLQESDVTDWIHAQNFSAELETKLLRLRPESYVGYAKENTIEMIKFIDKTILSLSDNN